MEMMDLSRMPRASQSLEGALIVFPPKLLQ